VNAARKNVRSLAYLTLSLGSLIAFAVSFVPGRGVSARQAAAVQLSKSAGTGQSVSMITADFDEDGVTDLVVGSALEKGGSIALMRGNHDAIAPQSHESWVSAGRRESVAPFFASNQTFRTSQRPDFLAAADLNGDGHLDIAYASKESAVLQVKAGNGKGSFLPQSSSITLPGAVTALASYRPEAPAFGEVLVAAYQTNESAHLAIVSYDGTGLRIAATYALPGAATSLVVANLDGDPVPDTAIVAGGHLLVLHGRNAIRGKGRLEPLPVDGIETVTAGQFLFDRHSQTQLAALTSDGDVEILAHQGFDPRPFTPGEVASMRHLAAGSQTLAQLAGVNARAPWTVVETNPQAGAHASGTNVPMLLRGRMSGSGGDDLVVLNIAQQQRVTISHAMGRSSSTAVSAPHVETKHLENGDSVVAAVAVRVNADGRSGLAVLKMGSPVPEFTVPSSGNTYYVNTTADNTGTTTDADDGTRCSQGAGEVCTLRDAVTFVNADAADNIDHDSCGNLPTDMAGGNEGLKQQCGDASGSSGARHHDWRHFGRRCDNRRRQS